MVSAPIQKQYIPEKGTINLGNDMSVSWDFSELFKALERRQLKKEREEFMICKDGKTMMYNLGLL